MKFVVTDAGLSAAQRARANGYQISLTQFKVGSAYNYNPSSSDTSLHGTELHTGGISGFAIIDPNTVQYTCIMDQDVGTFSYGEIGLYLEDGTLFALAAQPRVTEKLRGGPSSAGNKVAIEAQLKLTQAEAIFNFDVLQLANAKLLELKSVAQLKPPVISDTNAYLTHSRDGANSTIMAYKSDDFEWSFPNYRRLRTLTVGAPGSGYTSAPTVQITGGGGTGASATATVENGSVKSITLVSGGRNYTSAPTVTLTGGGGSGANATATIGRGVSDIQVTNQGQGYTSPPTVIISGGGGSGAEATARVQGGNVTGIVVTKNGNGYTTAPSVTLTGGSGSNATATANVSGVVTEINLVGNSTTSLVSNDIRGTVKLPATAGKYMAQFLTGDLKGFVRQITVATDNSLHWDITEKTGSAPKQGDTFALYVDIGSYIEEATGANKLAYTANGYREGDVNTLSLKQGSYRISRGVNTPAPDGVLFVYDVPFRTADGTEQIGDRYRKVFQQFMADDGKISIRRWTGTAWTSWTEMGGGLPVGSIVSFPKNIPQPAGFLKCLGGTFSRQTYPDLYTALGNKTELPNLGKSNVGQTAYFPFNDIPQGWIKFDEIRTRVTQQAYPELYRLLVAQYGSIGQVPTADDRFIRNASGLTVGTKQEDAIRNIKGEYFYGYDNDIDAATSKRVSDAYNKPNSALWMDMSKKVLDNIAWVSWLQDKATGAANFAPLIFDASRSVPTADEVRPKAIAMVLCIKAEGKFDIVDFYIKAFGGVSDTGNLDTVEIAKNTVPVGSIHAFPKEVNPVGYLLADGSAFDGNVYPNLKTVLGTNRLPNMKSFDSLGQLVMWTDEGALPDYLLDLNGQEVSRTLYPELFAIYGTKYGNGDGSTTFNLPDLRGEFPRFWDNGKGIDSKKQRTLLSKQLGTIIATDSSLPQSSIGFYLDGDRPSVPYNEAINARQTDGITAAELSNYQGVAALGAAGAQRIALNNGIIDPVVKGNQFFSQTRPRNVAVRACVIAKPTWDKNLRYWVKAYGSIDNAETLNAAAALAAKADKVELARVEQKIPDIRPLEQKIREVDAKIKPAAVMKLITESKQITVPEGITLIYVTLVGGGGGQGGWKHNTYDDGGNAERKSVYIAVATGDVLDITIGAGGYDAGWGDSGGGSGGISKISRAGQDLLVCNGGGGGRPGWGGQGQSRTYPYDPLVFGTNYGRGGGRGTGKGNGENGCCIIEGI